MGLAVTLRPFQVSMHAVRRDGRAVLEAAGLLLASTRRPRGPYGASLDSHGAVVGSGCGVF